MIVIEAASTFQPQLTVCTVPVEGALVLVDSIVLVLVGALVDMTEVVLLDVVDDVVSVLVEKVVDVVDVGLLDVEVLGVDGTPPPMSPAIP